jgi:hypothetical protein
LSTKILTGIIPKFFIFTFLFLPGYLLLNAQQDSTLLFTTDTIPVISDTTLTDSLIIRSPYGPSPDAIKSKVDYKAVDSIKFDITSQKVYMYKSNEINYEDINLKADYVEIEFTQKTVYATGTTDSTGGETGNPVFSMSSSSFESKAMKYNYESKKGFVEKVITEDSEGYLHGKTVKKMPDDITNVLDGSYTTCELENPHFSFKFRKAKVIPENKIVTGPAYLIIEDMPTPLFIPFGMFPNKKGQRSGIVIPSWGESTNRGFYFENGGYYFAISDYLDLKLLGDIYTLGSWAVKPTMNYRKRYRYNGNLSGNYGINILGEEGSPDYSYRKDFSVRWVHTQDPKARPNSKFSANVNIQSSQNNRYTGGYNTYLSNTFQSSVNYYRSWGGKYFLNTTLKHSQNTITREMDLSIPTITFTVNRFYPFRKKVAVGTLKWYDNISVNYGMAADNQLNTYDSVIFKKDLSRDFKNGMKHSVQLSSGSIKVLKHIVWSNNINYTERWYSQKHVRSWKSDSLYLDEGPLYGYVGTDTIYGFNAVRDFGFSTSMSTTVYGMFAYKKGPIRAVRHVIKPSVSFSIRPDFSTQEWGYYGHYINDNGTVQKYSYYDGFIYGTAPEGNSGVIGFRLSNNLEMKVRSRNDTVTGTKKVVLIEDFSISTGYDLARDSLNLNKLTLSGRTTLFKNLQITYSASFDPYALDSLQRRINKFEWDVNHRLFRTENHNWRAGLTYRLNSDILARERTSSAGTEQELRDVTENIEGYVDWNVPWTLNFSYDLNYSTNYKYENGYWNYTVTKDKNLIQTLSFSGDVNVTTKWKFGFRSGYDFENNEFTYTSLDVYRDLHCWEMRFSWIPYGFRQSWNFSINIKSSLLKDLKLDKKKDFRDY